MEFTDRHDAGRRLASQLIPLAEEQPVVVALPRGGVPVGREIATALDAPLDVLAVRKLGAPANPEYGIGAIAEDGTVVLDAAAAQRVGMTQLQLESTIAREQAELRRRMTIYRDGREPVDVRGRTVIVVDDGLATGVTDLAAVRALRARDAGRIVVAVPVGSREAVARLGDEADEVVCHTIPHDFIGVGRWYHDFSPVSDEEVRALLELPETPAVPEPALRTGDVEPRAPADPRPHEAETHALRFDVGGAEVAGDLTLPPEARGLVLFAHGSGSSRLSPRNRAVAETLADAGFATLLLDLLTDSEARRRELVFEIALLARRLELVTGWALRHPVTRELPIGYFGASTGAAAALRAAAAAGPAVRAVVSRGGRPDLAADRLPQVTAPTLLVVGGRDTEVLQLNERAAGMLRCPHRLVVVDGATHLFEEPGALEAVAELATTWFAEHLPANARAVASPAG